MRIGFLLCCITLIACILCSSAVAQKIVSPGLVNPSLRSPVSPAPSGKVIPLSAFISPSLYTERLGFICRQEWKLEKASGVAFRFRLGSLDYVNRLEGKYR